MPVLDLPPEILDAIIDKLHGDRTSLLRASLACRAFYPRTRAHLFSVAVLTGKSACERLRKLITLSPKLALHFTSLAIVFACPPTHIHSPTLYMALTVIESLINVTRLSLGGGEWHRMPDSVVSSLQSRSYHVVDTSLFFHFRSISEICSLVKNSPDLQEVRIVCRNSRIIEECNVNHSLHFTPTPVSVRINGSEDFSDSAGTLMKWVLSSGACPFSCNSINRLDIILRDASPATLWCTVLIIYRIVTVAPGSDIGRGLRAYRHVIEIMVESSALYSLTLILYVIFYAREDVTLHYFDSLVGMARARSCLFPGSASHRYTIGNCPALLVGRVAAGHARPDDSWQGSVISGSLRFRTRSGGQDFRQNYFTMGDDLEGHEREDEHAHHTLKGSREDTVNKIVVCRDSPEVRLERRGTVVYEDDIQNV